MGTPRKVSRDHQPSCLPYCFPQGFHLWLRGLWASCCYRPRISGTNGLEAGDGRRCRPRMGEEHLWSDGASAALAGACLHPRTIAPMSGLGQSTGLAASAFSNDGPGHP